MALSDRDYRQVRRRLKSRMTLEQIASVYFKGRFTTSELDAQMSESLEIERRRHRRRLDSVREYQSPKWVKVKTKTGNMLTVKYVPDHVLEDRERRQNAPETPNTRWLGDPVVPRWMSNADSDAKHRLGTIRGC